MSESANKYKELLINLHNEMVNFRDEGPLANQFREKMEVIWYQLTDDEKIFMENLSEELYRKDNL